MSPSNDPAFRPLVVVTGANGLVGSRVCAALADRGAVVRAVVRRAGSAPEDITDLEEVVGDFADPEVAAAAVRGADAVVTTVHPMGSDLETQRRVGVEGTVTVARAAAAAGVDVHVHLSTAAVYVREAGGGDVAEDGELVGDDAGDYPVTKRDLDAALAEVDGTTRVLLRPPAILGSGDSSVWNHLQPQAMKDAADARTINPDVAKAWVHVDDLAALAADLATGAIAAADDVADGPVTGGCTAVNVAGEAATQRDYVGTVTEVLGVDPVWTETAGWTGELRTDRARAWGWTPRVTLAAALNELSDDVQTLV